MILIALTPQWRVVRQAVCTYKSMYARKKRLMERILDAVGPALSRGLAGWAANLVIHWGVPWGSIEELLKLQREIRVSQAHGAKIFAVGLRRLARRHGVSWEGDGSSMPYWKFGGTTDGE